MITIFQQTRRIIAEHMAKTEWYILADDDCLIDPAIMPDAIAAAKEGFEKYKFGMMSLWPKPHEINPWKPPDNKHPWESLATVVVDENYMEHISVGGVRIIRKGCVQQWPVFIGPGYDSEHANAMRNAGYRIGYLRKFACEHLGADQSTVWGNEG